MIPSTDRDLDSVWSTEVFYIDASLEIRLQRRMAQGERDKIRARDQADSTRRSSPLLIAEDAYVIDSSNLTIEEVVGRIVEQLQRKGMVIN